MPISIQLQKHAGGRPRLWKNAQELEKKIAHYATNCEDNKLPFTLSGLALALGCSRRTLVKYANREEFFPTIQRARNYAEFSLETLLLTTENPRGIIFALKNNFGWRDKSKEILKSKFTISNVMNFIDIRSQDKYE